MSKLESLCRIQLCRIFFEKSLCRRFKVRVRVRVRVGFRVRVRVGFRVN